MTPISLDVTTAVFAKTALGQQEIQSRALGLPPLARRLLVLIDGKRTGQELAMYAPGQDLATLLQPLISHGCIDTPQSTAGRSTLPTGTTAPATVKAATDTHPDLVRLPDAHERSAKEVEMARNFMTNTINTIIGQNTRFTLIKSIHASATADDLRRTYPAWLEAMAGNSVGLKRLTELQDKLFKVL